MKAWSFYSPADGVILGRRIVCSANQLGGNTPQGFVPIQGVYDHLSQRVDITAQPDEAGNLPVIDYQPPAPANDTWQTWAWDAAIKRWVSTPTLAAIKRDRRNAMAQAWTAAREAGVSIGGKVAPTDAASWTRYLAIKQMAADGGWLDVPIPLADDTFELLTQAKAAALWAALKDMERALLAQLRNRIEAINAATTAEQVAAITWA